MQIGLQLSITLKFIFYFTFSFSLHLPTPHGLTGLFQCHNTGGNQEWAYTKQGQIKHDDLCLTLVQFARGSEVVMKECDSSENQRWTMREGGFLRHNKLNVCLDSRDHHEHGISAQRCNSALESQRWKFVANGKFT